MSTVAACYLNLFSLVVYQLFDIISTIKAEHNNYAHIEIVKLSASVITVLLTQYNMYTLFNINDIVANICLVLILSYKYAVYWEILQNGRSIANDLTELIPYQIIYFIVAVFEIEIIKNSYAHIFLLIFLLKIYIGPTSDIIKNNMINEDIDRDSLAAINKLENMHNFSTIGKKNNKNDDNILLNKLAGLFSLCFIILVSFFVQQIENSILIWNIGILELLWCNITDSDYNNYYNVLIVCLSSILLNVYAIPVNIIFNLYLFYCYYSYLRHKSQYIHNDK